MKEKAIKVKHSFRDPIEDRILYATVGVILAICVILVAYPLIYVLSSSFSDPQAVSQGKVVLWPVNFSVDGYKAVFAHRYVLPAYRNTIFYTVAGTAINLLFTLTCAYPMSRKDFPIRNPVMALFMFTMFFSGGLIPSFILNTKLGLYNTVWVMLIPGALNLFNMILVRTYFENSVPKELLEAASIDGCSDTRYFISILLPLSKPVIAVVTLYYAVGHWNEYFNALIYLQDKELYPIQLILREILVASEISMSDMNDTVSISGRQGMSDLLKYALIVVASAPIMFLYPFIQRYFIKGVMIGSVKG